MGTGRSSIGRPSGIRTRTAAAAAVVASVALGGCFQDQDWPDIPLEVSPFKNVYLDAGLAEVTVTAVEGYSCPDGRAARTYTIAPTSLGDATTTPLALLLHPGAFDYVVANGEHYSIIDRLNAEWAAAEVESMLGLDSDGAVAADAPGALVAALIENGFHVVAPTDCWGDLWHGTANNDYDEGFFRMGLYLADDVLTAALADLPVDPSRVLAVGLGEGGRGVTDLVRIRSEYGGENLANSDVTAVLIDSSPDDLRPVVGGGACSINADYVYGLHAIYGIDHDTDPDCDLLEAALEDAWFGSVVADGYQRPVAYQYSSIDSLVDDDLTVQTANAILQHLGPNESGRACVSDWRQDKHVFSNSDKYKADELVAWILSAWDGAGTATAPCPVPGS